MSGHDGQMAAHVLRLRVNADPERPDQPVVTVLVDGEDRLAGLGRTGFVGFHPAEILGPDQPLLPTDPPRRVAVYRCVCGIAGCGCVAPVIARDGGQVTWSDARDYTGVFDGPTLEPGYRPGPDEGTVLDLPVLRFDAHQYEEEVRRAGADRTWESDRPRR